MVFLGSTGRVWGGGDTIGVVEAFVASTPFMPLRALYIFVCELCGMLWDANMWEASEARVPYAPAPMCPP